MDIELEICLEEVSSNMELGISDLKSFKSDIDNLKKSCTSIMTDYYSDKRLLVLLQEIYNLENVYRKMFICLLHTKNKIDTFNNAIDDFDLSDLEESDKLDLENEKTEG